MKFLKFKRGASGSRRSNRLWLGRVRSIALWGGGASALLGLIVWAWIAGMFSAAGTYAVQKTIAATSSAGFKINDISVVGRINTPREELLARLNMQAGDAMFDVSVEESQAAIADISWVQEATVARRLPDTIVVMLKERTPAALWQYRKKITLIDAAGHVLSEHDLDRWRHLPLVVGEYAAHDVTALLGLLQAEPDIAQELSAAVRIGNRRWDLRLKNGVLVKLPENDVELALRQLAALKKTGDLMARDIRHIDMRIDGKLVVEANEPPKNQI